MIRSALSLVLLLVAACSSSKEPVTDGHQRLCTGDTCWDCQQVPVENGQKTHCDTPCTEDDGDSYECPGDGAGDSSCPPSDADKGKKEKKDKKPKKEKKDKGFKCKVEGGQRECDSPPTCDPGTHEAPCGKCVPDTCDSCDCEGGGGGSTGGGGSGCTLTQGFWKNHASAWPVQSLTIGGVSYTKAELLTILRTPPSGDASLILAHQLIASMLNAASGAGQAQVTAALADAQVWMSNNKDGDGRLPYGVSSSSAAGSAATALSSKLDAYNNGNMGVPHCD
jgi:hypothetical protein